MNLNGTFLLLFVGFTLSVKSNDIECWTCNSAKLKNTTCINGTCSISDVFGCSLKSCNQNCTNYCYSSLSKDEVTSGCTFLQCGRKKKKISLLQNDRDINGYFRKGIANDWMFSCGTTECNGKFQYSPYVYLPSEMEFHLPLESTTASDKDVDVRNSDILAPNIVYIVVGVVACVFIMLLSLTIYILVKRKYSPNKLVATSDMGKYQHQCLPGDDSWDENSDECSMSTYKTKLDSAASSSVATQYSRGSSSSDAQFAYLPIKRRRRIASGRYARVYEAVLMQDKNESIPVSVKAFSLRNYGAWRQEIDMLSESWMHHDNIIEYYMSEQRNIRGHLEYWLITSYYQNGSLANFLLQKSITWPQLTGMVTSIAKGLSYLHAERDLRGEVKVPIAHRDIKSTNILVKDDIHSCVIADFGLSLKLHHDLTGEDCANAGQVGTPRYMSPELLERLINIFDPESFKRTDVYAMGLVVWEMINCCEATPGMASPYQAVYGEHVKEFPTKQQMLILVCKNRILPPIKNKWLKHKGLAELTKTLNELLEYVAEERITADCLVERMNTINYDVTMNYDEFVDAERRLSKNEIDVV